MAMDRFPSNILDFIKKYRKKVKEILGIEGPEYFPEDVSNEDVDALFDGGGGGGSSSSSSSESGSGEDPSIMTEQLFDDLVTDFSSTNPAMIKLNPDTEDTVGSVTYGGFSGADGFIHAYPSDYGYLGYLLYLDAQLIGIVLKFAASTPDEEDSWILYPADSVGGWESNEYELNIRQDYLALTSGASFDSEDIPVLRDNQQLSGTISINLTDTGSDIFDTYEFM